MKNKFVYQCTDCSAEYETNEVIYLCPKCSKTNSPEKAPKGVLKVIYRYDELRKKNDLWNSLKNSNFLELLPINNSDSLPKLRVGQTPSYKISELDNQSLNFELFLKDDSQNPTFSFKDRASALVSAFARQRNIETIVAASTGNAGSSLAGICASQKQKAIIFVPAAAPKAKLTQIVMYGAKVVPVDGNYDMAFDLSIEATKRFGWYNRNTAFNPITVEGKKTVSFEIIEQLYESQPERIFVPVGDGVIIAGVYKGMEDLLKLGVIEKMPIIVAVQAEGSSNLADNLFADPPKFASSKTIADSISVDIPRNFFMAKQFIINYKGETVKVSDAEIIEASSILSRNTGIFAEPAATAAFAGMLKFKKENRIPKNSRNLVLLTGSGLKDLNSVQAIVNIPKPVKADIKEVEKFLNM